MSVMARAVTLTALHASYARSTDLRSLDPYGQKTHLNHGVCRAISLVTNVTIDFCWCAEP